MLFAEAPGLIEHKIFGEIPVECRHVAVVHDFIQVAANDRLALLEIHCLSFSAGPGPRNLGRSCKADDHGDERFASMSKLWTLIAARPRPRSATASSLR